MTNVDIRQVTGDEFLEIALKVAGYAFEASPPGADRAEWVEFLSVVEAAHFVVFEDGKGVTTASYSRMHQHVRGAMFMAGGVWGVASDPRARRKGYVRQAMVQLLAAMRAEGMPLSMLYPFRESFYDRLGYVTFPQPRTATIAASALLPLLKWEIPGTVELLSIADGFDRYRAFLEQHQRRIHGMGLFGERPASRMRKQNQVWVLAAQVDGEDVGIMTYRIEGQPRNLTSHAFFPADSGGRYLLLEWLARHADQVKDVELKLPASAQPETWLPDLNVAVSAGHPPMGRVIDVRGLDGMLAGSGRFTARIVDVQCPWNGGQFTFESADGILRVTPAQDVECSLTIQGLTALVYGTHDPEDFAVRGWGNPGPPVQATMRSMFPPRLPYLHEVF